MDIQLTGYNKLGIECAFYVLRYAHVLNDPIDFIWPSHFYLTSKHFTSTCDHFPHCFIVLFITLIKMNKIKCFIVMLGHCIQIVNSRELQGNDDEFNRMKIESQPIVTDNRDHKVAPCRPLKRSNSNLQKINLNVLCYHSFVLPYWTWFIPYSSDWLWLWLWLDSKYIHKYMAIYMVIYTNIWPYIWWYTQICHLFYLTFQFFLLLSFET